MNPAAAIAKIKLMLAGCAEKEEPDIAANASRGKGRCKTVVPEKCEKEEEPKCEKEKKPKCKEKVKQPKCEDEVKKPKCKEDRERKGKGKCNQCD